MSKKDDALKLALEALMEATKIHASSCKCSVCRAVIVAQDALAEQPCTYPNCPYPCPDLPDCRDAEKAHQEPVAWLHPANATCVTTDPTAYARGIPLYTSPQPSKPWVGLTDEEIEGLLPPADGSAEENKVRVEVQPGIWGAEYEEVDAWSLPLVRQAIRAIEAKLREKNA